MELRGPRSDWPPRPGHLSAPPDVAKPEETPSISTRLPA
jgi:hypothetical protein